MPGEDAPQTKRTLLSRLRNLDDQESWRSFFDIYWQLLYNVARKSGLDDASAQDVVQETVIGVAKAIPGFKYDPSRGSFKQWLLRIVQRRIIDQFRRAYRQPPRADISLELLEDNEALAGALIDDHGGRIEAAWDHEWERTVFDAALATVRQSVHPKHFQVFDYCVLKGWGASKVANTLGLSTAQVYLAKHRVGQAMKRAVREINESRVTGRLA
jgi:RNA polymerase sigma-70 factor (ECF subfamily)